MQFAEPAEMREKNLVCLNTFRMLREAGEYSSISSF